MKRQLLSNVKVIPYTSGTPIDSEGFLSGIIAANATASGKLSFAITESDTNDGTFTAVADKNIAVDGAALTDIAVTANDIVNIDLDIVGCKRFIKITVTGATAAFAVALGDSAVQPA